MFWAGSDIPPADKGPELFSSKKKRNIPAGKIATATNLPFSPGKHQQGQHWNLKFPA